MKAKTWLSPMASTRDVIEKKTRTRVHGCEVCVFVDVLLIEQTITQRGRAYNVNGRERNTMRTAAV